MIIITQFHITSFARLLCFILMKDTYISRFGEPLVRTHFFFWMYFRYIFGGTMSQEKRPQSLPSNRKYFSIELTADVLYKQYVSFMIHIWYLVGVLHI